MGSTEKYLKRLVHVQVDRHLPSQLCVAALKPCSVQRAACTGALYILGQYFLQMQSSSLPAIRHSNICLPFHRNSLTEKLRSGHVLRSSYFTAERVPTVKYLLTSALDASLYVLALHILQKIRIVSATKPKKRKTIEFTVKAPALFFSCSLGAFDDTWSRHFE